MDYALDKVNIINDNNFELNAWAYAHPTLITLRTLNIVRIHYLNIFHRIPDNLVWCAYAHCNMNIFHRIPQHFVGWV